MRFIKKIGILALIITVCFGFVVATDFFLIGPQDTYGFQASLVDKVNRLKSIDGPKIILVGHSNLAFGVHSDVIQKELGIPVVNLGFHGSLGNAYNEQIAQLSIHEGDIVVVCHSTFSDEDVISDPRLAWYTTRCDPQLFSILRPKDYITMLPAYPSYIRRAFSLWVLNITKINQRPSEPPSSYFRAAFNEYGDIVYKPEIDQMDCDAFFAKEPIPVPEINEICINRLNDFNAYCNERGASLVVAGYPIAYGKYAEFTEQDFIDFQAQLEKQLDCDVISDYTDYFYPYDYFYDTQLHLTNEGAEVRTRQLISDLNRWLAR